MNQLPKHIADMCGVVIAKTQSQAPAEEFQAINAVWDDMDEAMIINYRDAVIGWVNDVESNRSYKYRALSKNGQVKHFYTVSRAIGWLIEEAI